MLIKGALNQDCVGITNNVKLVLWKGDKDCFALLAMTQQVNLICGRFIRIAASRKAGLAMTV
jgi:hypothetical protein